MRAFKQKIFWVAIISGILFFASFHPFAKAQEEKSSGFSLQLQAVIKGVWNKITQILPVAKQENYKERYFKVLRELAELKLQEKDIKTGQSFEILKSKYPDATQLKTLKIGEAGTIYLEKSDKIKEGAVVVDDNSILVGRVHKVRANFIEARTLEYPGIEFNIADMERNLFGIGKTTGMGYIEINFIDPKIKNIQKDELVMTYGGDKIFPQSFIFGRVIKIEQQMSFQKAIIEPIADFSSDYYFIIP